MNIVVTQQENNKISTSKYTQKQYEKAINQYKIFSKPEILENVGRQYVKSRKYN